MAFTNSWDRYGSVDTDIISYSQILTTFLLDVVSASYVYTRYAGLPRSATQGTERAR